MAARRGCSKARSGTVARPYAPAPLTTRTRRSGVIPQHWPSRGSCRPTTVLGLRLSRAEERVDVRQVDEPRERALVCDLLGGREEAGPRGAGERAADADP